ncbi:MAG: 50S ribosomal protein L4 [Candidatus Portnoybacteria bacterium CG10_big_fil_rev_8_21_14_0_10_36_7]|uniref:Large ribosomal subunit protein uL4 n=1 Tax=Candidatus Portnoybacteria bacterium CG10_big_fil_rev_8_21_14_0_10_36_7 TaxID=1974812 RepID=A0A2M8KDE1_9BACT|nr:MAG: 50S ribosomal protein L4 [Candidatus Portnoybacteria bacterium CG10_big_fil_rev_8_21_14_0_10_36_7]
MKYPVHNIQGKNVGEVNLPDRIFAVNFNHNLVHQAMITQEKTSREAIADARMRGEEVRGGGKKPWAQKGTGRSRHGSSRSPIWKGGGVTFGPTNERNWAQKINKKAKQKALFMVLSQKAKENELVVLDNLEIIEPKTKEVSGILKNIFNVVKSDRPRKTIIVTPKKSESVVRASHNLPYLQTIGASSLNILDILKNKYLIIPQSALESIEKTFTKI